MQLLDDDFGSRSGAAWAGRAPGAVVVLLAVVAVVAGCAGGRPAVVGGEAVGDAAAEPALAAGAGLLGAGAAPVAGGRSGEERVVRDVWKLQLSGGEAGLSLVESWREPGYHRSARGEGLGNPLAEGWVWELTDGSGAVLASEKFADPRVLRAGPGPAGEPAVELQKAEYGFSLTLPAVAGATQVRIWAGDPRSGSVSAPLATLPLVSAPQAP
jgi:hypothetical protein